MKTSQLVRDLQRAGCRLVRHGGRHDIWIGPTGQISEVPRHGKEEVKRKTLDSIYKKLLGRKPG